MVPFVCLMGILIDATALMGRPQPAVDPRLPDASTSAILTAVSTWVVLEGPLPVWF